jgi:hypothetical protein
MTDGAIWLFSSNCLFIRLVRTTAQWSNDICDYLAQIVVRIVQTECLYYQTHSALFIPQLWLKDQVHLPTFKLVDLVPQISFSGQTHP